MLVFWVYSDLSKHVSLHEKLFNGMFIQSLQAAYACSVAHYSTNSTCPRLVALLQKVLINSYLDQIPKLSVRPSF